MIQFKHAKMLLVPSLSSTYHIIAVICINALVKTKTSSLPASDFVTIIKYQLFLHSKIICFTFIDGCMPWQFLECVYSLSHSTHPAHSGASIDSRVDRIALPVRQDCHRQAL